MKRDGLVEFRHLMCARDQAHAWRLALELSQRRGMEPPPTRYRIKYLHIRIHPDDVVAMTEFCRQLDIWAGRIDDPHLPKP